MDTLTAAAASGMRSRMEALDLLANNLANASSPGFKSDREFYGLYSALDTSVSERGGDPALLPVIEKNWTDLSQGTFTPTGNSSDIALDGPGFFRIDSADGKATVTRNGSFTVNGAGQLATKAGHIVKGIDGKPVNLKPGLDFVVAADGSITQDGQPVGQLAIFQPRESNSLEKMSGGYYRIADVNLKTASDTRLIQGQLEASNTAPAEQAIRLVTIMRQFEGLQKALALGADLNRMSIEEVARVGN